MTLAYDELVNFIAAGSTASEVADFSPSKKTKARVWQLLRRAKSRELNDKNRAELEHYLQLEHILRLAKAKARLRVKHG